MARYSVHAKLASLNVVDTPIRCITPHGPKIDFTATYNQRESQQPSTFHYSNLGPKWTFNWLSYVSDDPNNQLPVISVYVQGGGAEIYSYNLSTQTFDVQPRSHTLLVRTLSGYERTLPDGSKQIYDLSDNAGGYPRRFFMTKVYDSTGDSVTIEYDQSFRVMSVKDQLGQGMTFSYDLQSDTYKITKVTEVFPTQPPLPRSATFDYTNGKLTTITDEIGIQSVFHYSTGTDSMDSLQTPYGTTTFVSGGSGTNRSIEITDPMLGHERVEYLGTTNAIGGSETIVPSASGITNSGLDAANTFYWDKKAMADAPGVYNKARIIHWAKNADETVSGIVASEKAPLENRVWYTYKEQPDSNHVGSSANPTQVVRVLDNANPTTSTQVWSYDYYDKTGKLKKAVDPKNRTTTYRFDGLTQMDLLAVYQQNTTGVSTDPYGVAADKIAGYDRYYLHKPQDVFDAAGQKTVYTYNTFGQVGSITNPRNEVTTYIYGDGSSGHPIGFLRSVTSPSFNGASAVTSYTCDLVNRTRTVRNEADDYTVTTDYDKLDRPITITYPDTTTQEFDYRKCSNGAPVTPAIMTLDAGVIKDRRGRPTFQEFDGNRRLTKVIDPLNHITQYVWCACGAMTDIIDADGHDTHFELDLQSRVKSKVFGYGTSDATTVSYLYEGQGAPDAVGTTSRLKSMTDALNQTTTYDYFVDDDVKQIIYTNAVHTTPNVSFLYDSIYNRLASMTDGTGTTSYSYYQITATPPLGADQLQTVDGPLANDAITYGYDEWGRVTSRSINGVSSSVNYDSLGRLDTSDNILGHFSRVYDGATHVTPRLKTLNLPNGQTANYSYFDNSQDRRLQTLQDVTSGSLNVSKFDYANYDPEGQIKDWTKTLGRSAAIASSHTYDSDDQLTGVTNTTAGNPPTSFSYGYDFAGNRTSDSVTPNYSINNLNQITNTGYTHDVDGNMTNDGVRGFEWDAASRLTAIVYPGDAGRSEFTYDGLGRRVQIVEKDGHGSVQRTSKFVWDGMTIAEERDKYNNVVKRFLPEGVQVLANASPNSKLFYSRDHLGSVRSLTNETGTLLSTVDYDSYGSISRPPVPANPTSGGPVITAAESQLTHGSAGMFAIPLPLSGAPGIEMRTQGGTYTLMLTFDRPVVSGTATIASGVGTVNGLPTFSGNTATVQLSGVANRQTITVELDNVVGVTGVTDKVLVAMSVLVGDVSQDGAVTGIDSDLVRSSSGASITAATFKRDVTANGFINSGDFSVTDRRVPGRSALPRFRLYRPLLSRSQRPLSRALPRLQSKHRPMAQQRSTW